MLISEKQNTLSWLLDYYSKRKETQSSMLCSLLHDNILSSQVVIKQTHGETGVCLMVQKLSPDIQLSSIQHLVVARAVGHEFYV